jgi:hypothetical protein
MPLYFGGKYPISYYATLPQTHWVFSVSYTFAAIFFWIFTKHHLTKYYHVPVRTFGVSLLLFAGTGLFPYDPNNLVSLIIHSFLALSSGLVFVLGMYLMAKAAKNTLIFRVTMTAILLSLSLTAAYLLSPHDSHLIFAFESGSWLMLQLWTIWISFHAYNEDRRHRLKAHSATSPL